jgi:hypothetical protein
MEIIKSMLSLGMNLQLLKHMLDHLAQHIFARV